MKRRLAESIGCLEAGHYLVVQTRDEDAYYVQFAAGGPEGLRAEAVSNRFLSGWRRLDDTAHGRLRRLGWRPPTDIGDGPVNWWRAYPAGEAPEAAAALAVDTLRKVFDVARPVGLVYHAFAGSGAEILLPGLGLARKAATPPLQDRVEGALRRILDLDELVRDEDGDFPIRRGEDMVYVRVVADPAYVSVFSPSLLGVEPTPDLFAAINEFNCSIRGARANFRDGAVVVGIEVDDQPEIGAALFNAYRAVSSLTDACASELQPRVGGQRYFGDPVPRPGPEGGYGVYL